MTTGKDVSLVGSRLIHEGWGRFLVVRLRMPDGSEVDREVEDHGSAVAVLPYDPERRVAMLVRQPRTPVLVATGAGGALLEAPAGRLDSADPEACTRREALEEVGLRLQDLEHVGDAWAMPSVSTERLHLFLAPFSARDEIAPGGGLVAEGELIEVERVPLRELAAMTDRGEVTDLKTIALVQTLRLRRPDLFVG